MKAALAVNRVGPSRAQSLAEVERLAREAAERGAELVLFPEACLTGLVNDDVPEHDLPLGCEVPGQETERLARLTKETGLLLALGILERSRSRLYDSALLLLPSGEIGLHYRRISPGWHGRKADPKVYGKGDTLRVARTPLGSFSFLICGDLFDDGLVAEARRLAPDWLLVPFARSFDDGSQDQARWDSKEKPAYIEQARRTGATALLVNCLSEEDHSFGGALAVSPEGVELASLPLGRPGVLVVDL